MHSNCIILPLQWEMPSLFAPALKIFTLPLFLLSPIFYVMPSQDVETEIAGLAYILRKLWGGLRTLWRNSPQSSNDDRIQALKERMQRNHPAVTRLHHNTPMAVIEFLKQ